MLFSFSFYRFFFCGGRRVKLWLPQVYLNLVLNGNVTNFHLLICLCPCLLPWPQSFHTVFLHFPWLGWQSICLNINIHRKSNPSTLLWFFFYSYYPYPQFLTVHQLWLPPLIFNSTLHLSFSAPSPHLSVLGR